MKQLTILTFALLILFACATTKVPSPAQDSYFLIQTGQTIFVPKGYFDDPKNFWTEEEYQEMRKKYQEYQKQRLENYYKWEKGVNIECQSF